MRVSLNFRFMLLLALVWTAVSAHAQNIVTLSGRITNQSTGQGIADVAVVAVGNQTGTRVVVTDAQGNYSLPFGSNTNIRLRAYKPLHVFNPLLVGYSSVGGFPISGSITQDFSGTSFPVPILIVAFPPILLTENESLNLLGLDGVLQTRDPLSSSTTYLGAVDQTRLQLFMVDMELYSGETLSIISVTGTDAQQVSHTFQVEDLRKVPGVPWLSQLTVKVPSDVVGPTELLVTVTARGQASNTAKLRVK